MWKIQDNSMCEICKLVDTIEHYLFHCKKNNKFWESVNKCLKEVAGIKVEFTVLEIIFGIIDETEEDNNISNIIILYGKKFIYECKQSEKDISFLEFFRMFKKKLELEREIYCSNDQLQIFQKKYGVLYKYL